MWQGGERGSRKLKKSSPSRILVATGPEDPTAFLTQSFWMAAVGRGGHCMGRFLAIYNLVKNQKNLISFHGCNIQVSVHMSLKLQGKHIYQTEYIISSTAYVFGLGHDMGCFARFILGSTQLLHNFIESKKVAKKSKL